MMTSFVWAELSPAEKKKVLERPILSRNEDLKKTVGSILSAVKQQGDTALMSYTRQWDCPSLEDFPVTLAEIQSAKERTPVSILKSLEEAIRRIQSFHQAQQPSPVKVETSSGVFCEKRFVPIEKVGLYVPGGSAPLPSTLMMLAIPALVAGCSEIALVTPPGKTGQVSDVILAAADLLGIKNIFKCGGAQAIAALAYGTESIPKVDKIYGPGNAWVTEAKMQVAFDPQGAAIDLPAGPSEVLVVADSLANPVFVAADLLSQAEHDVASQVIFVSTDSEMIENVKKEVQRQVETLPRRDIACRSLEFSRFILAKNIQEAMEIANQYAPEHLILQVKNASDVASLVRHAGSVFIGAWTPESVGDYASGTNHVLPTYGFARAFSGLGLTDFMKSISFQELTPRGLQDLGPTVECLAEAEGLQAHARAVSVRLQQISKESL